MRSVGKALSSVLSLRALSLGWAGYEGDIPVPKRELEWGQVNFLATSDTHGKPFSLLTSDWELQLTLDRLASRTSTCTSLQFQNEFIARSEWG